MAGAAILLQLGAMEAHWWGRVFGGPIHCLRGGISTGPAIIVEAEVVEDGGEVGRLVKEFLKTQEEEWVSNLAWGSRRLPLSDASYLVGSGVDDSDGCGVGRSVLIFEYPAVSGVPQEVGYDGGK